MNRFIFKFLLFTLIFTALSYALSRFYGSIVMRDSTQMVVDRQFRAYTGEIQFLFLGDSHPMSAVDPEVVENSFVYTTPGEDYIQTYYKLKYALKENAHREEVRVVVMPLDLHTFSSFRRGMYEDEYYWRRYVNFFETASETGRYGEYLGKYLLGNFAAYFGGREDVFNFIRSKLPGAEPGAPEVIISGHKPFTGDFRKTVDSRTGGVKRRIDYLFKGYELFDPALVDYFGRCLELCREQGKIVVLVRYPLSREHYNAALEYIDESSYGETLEGLLEGQNVIMLDFHDLFFDHNELFSDSDHLNVEGARMFSRILSKSLQEVVKAR